MNSIILILGMLSCIYEILGERKLLRVYGYTSIALLMHFFINTEYLWIAYIWWELISIWSAILVYEFDSTRTVKTERILLISLISGAGFLYTILGLPITAKFTDLDLSNFYVQLGLIIAIWCKSGLFPLVWPQMASIAHACVTAYLHSATVIWCGIYLLLKIKPCSLITTTLSLGSYLTILWAWFRVSRESDMKKVLACLTQVQVASSIIMLNSGSSPTSIQTYILSHSIIKFVMFLGVDKSRNNTTIDYIITIIMLLISSGFISYHDMATSQTIYAESISLIALFRFVMHHQKTQLLLSRQNIIQIAILLYISCNQHGFRLPITQLAIAFGSYGLIRIIPGIRFKLGRFPLHQLHWLCAFCLIVYFGYSEFNYTPLIPINSIIDLLTLFALILGLWFIYKAKQRFDIIAGLNLLSMGVSASLMVYGGIEVAATQILADVIVTIYLLNTNLSLNKLVKLPNYWISILAGFGSILFHPGKCTSLVFPIPANLNAVNEVVVNWRLLDTLGEVLVLYLAGRI